MNKLPSFKVTTQTVTTLLVGVISLAALQFFEVELDDTQVALVSSVVGWLVGFVAAYFVTETNPPPSALPHLKTEQLQTELSRR